MHQGHLYYIAVGIAFGLFVFIYSAVRTKTLKPDLGQLIESVGRGAFLGAGVHLCFCSIWPEMLVHAVNADTGAVVHLPEKTIYQMDSLHRMHVFAGGIATIFLAGYALMESCIELYEKPNLSEDELASKTLDQAPLGPLEQVNSDVNLPPTSRND
jgi:hypothetical protein